MAKSRAGEYHREMASTSENAPAAAAAAAAATAAATSPPSGGDANTFLFTSESVNEGHPDKLCDQVSDAVLDACLKDDPLSRVACETVAKTGMVMIVGEITTNSTVNYEQV